MSSEELQIGDVQKNVIGGSIRGDGNIFGESVKVVNNTIQLQLDDEGKERLAKLLSIKTDVSPQYGESAEVASTAEVSRMKEDLGKLISMVDHLQKKGEIAAELSSGTLNISQGEMLLKKAILLKTEAELMLLDQVEVNKINTDLASKYQASEIEVDLSVLMSGVDEESYLNKMQESLKLLREANKRDPYNVEILLHLAQVVGQLEPDQPAKERKILGKALNLLRHPKNDSEWFLKAEATFLMATAGDETHPDLLEDAREIFERINRRDWVRQCDDLLDSFGEKMNDSFIESPSTQPLPHSESQQTLEFHPVGRWHVEANDGTVIDIHFLPNGVVQGTQKNAMTWQNFSFNGQWAYVPYNRMLQIQGLTNFGYPFVQVITIQQKTGEKFTGFDVNGYYYEFQRV